MLQAQVPTAIGSLLDDRLRVTRPLAIGFEQEGDYWIAACEEFEEFGYGGDPFSALDDLRQTLAELYWTLKSDHDRLAPGMAALWERIRHVIVES